MKSKVLILVFFLTIVSATGYFIFSDLIKAIADTNISSEATEYFAWDDVVGWWDFYNTNSVVVRGSKIEGYATSTEGFGYMSLDCATTPIGSVCDTSIYGICNGPGPKQTDGSCPNADAEGILTGFAWNDEVGWISFNCNQSSYEGGSNQCQDSNYRVEIGSEGYFTGYAWNDLVGWISFNCANHAGCNDSDYKVVTSWRPEPLLGFLESAVFDSSVEGGVVLNNIIWQGTLPANTKVDFQIAVSNNPEGPWEFKGPDGTSDTFYGAPCELGIKGGTGSAPPGEPICVNPEDTKDKRYLRYKVRLESNLLQTETPTINDIILNWSR